jgi:hypothetical protein
MEGGRVSINFLKPDGQKKQLEAIFVTMGFFLLQYTVISFGPIWVHISQAIVWVC